MKYAIFADDFYRDETAYGLFKIMKETSARWTFEHIAGSNLNDSGRGKHQPGHVFNYHNKAWLDKHDARSKAIAWIEDPEMFDDVVQAHKDLEAALKGYSTDYREDCADTRELFSNRIGNYSTEAPE